MEVPEDVEHLQTLPRTQGVAGNMYIWRMKTEQNPIEHVNTR